MPDSKAGKPTIDPLWRCVEGDRLNPLITFRGHVALIAAKEVLRYFGERRKEEREGYSRASCKLRAELLDNVAQDVRDLTDVICKALE